MNEIPNDELLYRYAKPEAFPLDQSEIPASIFNDPELSCDWEQYQKNPRLSYHVQQGKSVIVGINVCEAIKNPTNPKRAGVPVPHWKQEIVHAPSKSNDSHSLIRGKKKSAVTSTIRDNSRII